MTRRGGDFLVDQTHGSVLKELVRDVLAHEQQTLVVAKYFYHKNQGQYGFTEVHWVKRLLVTLPEMSKFINMHEHCVNPKCPKFPKSCL